MNVYISSCTYSQPPVNEAAARYVAKSGGSFR
jgi:hypothetical protein